MQGQLGETLIPRKMREGVGVKIKGKRKSLESPAEKEIQAMPPNRGSRTLQDKDFSDFDAVRNAFGLLGDGGPRKCFLNLLLQKGCRSWPLQATIMPIRN